MSLVLPFAEWPEQDRDMWRLLVKSGGPLDDKGALNHLRATSLRPLLLHYGRWLAWLTVAQPLSLDEAPEARASMALLSAWLEALAHVKPMTKLAFVSGTLRVLGAAAPNFDWTEQRRLQAYLRRNAGRGDQSRKLGRVLSSDVLMNAGLKLAGLTPMLQQHRWGALSGKEMAR